MKYVTDEINRSTATTYKGANELAINRAVTIKEGRSIKAQISPPHFLTTSLSLNCFWNVRAFQFVMAVVRRWLPRHKACWIRRMLNDARSRAKTRTSMRKNAIRKPTKMAPSYCNERRVDRKDDRFASWRPRDLCWDRRCECCRLEILTRASSCRGWSWD